MRKCHVMHWLSFGKKQLNPDFTNKTLVVLPYLRDVRFASGTHFKHNWLTVFKPKYFFQNLLLLQSFFVMSTSSCSNTLENSRPPLSCSPFDRLRQRNVLKCLRTFSSQKAWYFFTSIQAARKMSMKLPVTLVTSSVLSLPSNRFSFQYSGIFTTPDHHACVQFSWTVQRLTETTLWR